MAQFWAKTHTLIIQSHILYIFIINFCCLCSKLPSKIHFIPKITIYVGINFRLVSIYVVSKQKQLITVFCFDNLFYVYIQLIFRVHNQVYITIYLQVKLTIHYYIVFHYLYKALLIYNTLPYSTIYTYYFSILHVLTIKYIFILTTLKYFTYINMS